MNTLRITARRSLLFVALFLLVFAPLGSGSPVYANTSTPLTQRSLTLSSSSPGWDYLDPSGNGTSSPPNSGTNGQKSGNSFSFNVGTDSSTTNTVKALTFQYCTTASGTCMAPGNNATTGSAPSMTRASNGPVSIAAKQSDLDVISNSPTEVPGASFGSFINPATGDMTQIPAADNSQGNYLVLSKDTGASQWSANSGWNLTASNSESGTVGAGTATGAHNFITLSNPAGGLNLHPGGEAKIIFVGTNTNYITNPGSGVFFVRINDYNSAVTLTQGNLLDSGVTVATVMNQSIPITAKVLETMDFSVGTVDPTTLSTASANNQLSQATNGTQTVHGLCDPILGSMSYNDPRPNTLSLGDPASQNSLRVDKTYIAHSYWRLGSNSTAGATVYYSGATLTDAAGDQINPIGTTASAPTPGSPQFGLALANGTNAANYNAGMPNPYIGNFNLDYSTESASGKAYENGADGTARTNGVDPTYTSDIAAAGLTAIATATDQLAPLRPLSQYDSGSGVVNPGTGIGGLTGGYGPVATTKFAFDGNSNLIPTPIATENSQIINCATAKVRYIANIAATTPAGIYTTRINFIAAPVY